VLRSAVMRVLVDEWVVKDGSVVQRDWGGYPGGDVLDRDRFVCSSDHEVQVHASAGRTVIR
jgi:hypothetical protein